MRRIAIAALVAASVVGCGSNVSPFGGPYSGSSSYTATLDGATQGISAAEPLELTVEDPNGESTGRARMHFGSGCVMAVAYVWDREVVTSGLAPEASLQSCEFPVQGGTAVLDVVDLQSTLVAGTSIDVTLDGHLQSWLGTAARGYFTVTFHGQGPAPP